MFALCENQDTMRKAGLSVRSRIVVEDIFTCLPSCSMTPAILNMDFFWLKRSPKVLRVTSFVATNDYRKIPYDTLNISIRNWFLATNFLIDDNDVTVW